MGWLSSLFGGSNAGGVGNKQTASTTTSTTQTTYNNTDNRIVADNGAVAVSGNGSLYTTTNDSLWLSSSDSHAISNSGNTTDNRSFADNHAITNSGNTTDSRSFSSSNSNNTTLTLTDGGAVAAGTDLARYALQSMNGQSDTLTQAAVTLGQQGVNMQRAASDLTGQLLTATSAMNRESLAATQSLLDKGASLVSDVLGMATKSQQGALDVAAQVAAKPISANNDNRYLIAGGLVVVAIVAIKAFGKS